MTIDMDLVISVMNDDGLLASTQLMDGCVSGDL